LSGIEQYLREMKYFNVPPRLCCSMPRSRRHIKKKGPVHDELAFPAPYRDQARYLELAARFLELDLRHQSGDAIPIDQGKRAVHRRNKKAA
jgi:hypothetical protein